jgi:hypothetical protein
MREADAAHALLPQPLRIRPTSISFLMRLILCLSTTYMLFAVLCLPLS